MAEGQSVQQQRPAGRLQGPEGGHWTMHRLTDQIWERPQSNR